VPDIVVVGAGLAGLFASALAASRGTSVTLVTLGRGGLGFSHGCIDAALAEPLRPPAGSPPHPVTLAGRAALQGAADHLLGMLSHADLHYTGSLEASVETLTSLGYRRTTQFAPESMVFPVGQPGRRVAIAGIQAFRDFVPALACRRLAAQGVEVVALEDLPWPGEPPRRDLYATDLARLLDDADIVADLCALWRPRLAGIDVLGLPAILGLAHHTQVLRQVETRLGLRVFEIPTLPPSVPGLRLEDALRRSALGAGVAVIEGARAIGRTEAKDGRPRASGIVAGTAGGPRFLPAGRTLLATGGILHGGLAADQAGTVQESVFGIPVAGSPQRADWVGAELTGEHLYPQFGVRANDSMQPVDDDGEVVASDLFVAGGLIAGPDRLRSRCRQGIDLATAFRAVEVMLA
jgi:glycerol-3-phosphate dehydrogenase subunit B